MLFNLLEIELSGFVEAAVLFETTQLVLQPPSADLEIEQPVQEGVRPGEIVLERGQLLFQRGGGLLIAAACRERRQLSRGCLAGAGVVQDRREKPSGNSMFLAQHGDLAAPRLAARTSPGLRSSTWTKTLSASSSRPRSNRASPS